jgi:hypothetical protein
MRFHGLLREEEANPDLAVHEAVRDQLEHFYLAVRGLLLELPEGPIERDDLGRTAVGHAAGRHLVETTGMVGVPGQDGLALSSVHDGYIGAAYAGL